MGLHEVCKNPKHHFSREYDIEMVYDPNKDDYLLWGVCSECGISRLIYESTLRKPEIVKYKLQKIKVPVT